MNKYQKFYVDATIKSLDQQYKKVNKKLEDIYKEHSTNREVLIDKLSRTILDYKVTAEFMDLTPKEQRAIKKNLQMTIHDLIIEEEAKEKEFIKKTLGDATANTYKYQEYILSLGIDFKSLPLTSDVITAIVMAKVKKKLWIDRLGVNKGQLEKQLQNDIDKFLKGNLSINKIGQNIRDRWEIDFNNSQRLVRTELARVQGAILDKFDKDHEVEWQLWISTLDSKTSKICRELDGNQYAIDDPNKPEIPRHPNCRSALVGIPHKDYKPTTRRDNENNEIIPYKTYNQWEKSL